MPIPGVRPSSIKAAAKKPAPKLAPPKPPPTKGVRGSVAPPKSPIKGVTGSAGPVTLSLKNLNTEARKSIQRQRARDLPKPKGTGLSLLNPGAVVTQGYKNLATITGIKALNEVGKLPSEAVNIPTQAAVGAFLASKGAVNAAKGHPHELEHLGSEMLHQSAVAHAVKGEFGKALKAAEEHPLGTALEASGGAALVDRLAKTIADASSVGARDVGATISREPRQLPKAAVPSGGVAEPLKPYYKGLVRPKVEKKLAAKEMSQGKARGVLGRNFDQLEAEALAATRHSREQTHHEYHKLLKNVPGAEAVSHFANGLLADPKILTKDGTPLYRKQLGEAIEHYSQAPPHETLDHARLRLEVRAHLTALQHDKAFHANPDKAYQVARKIAAKKAKLEPELKHHRVYAGETMRIAKLIKAFRYHFRNQDAFVEPNSKLGESPFRLNGKEIPVSQVVKRLEAHGIHEDQLAFSSSKPFQTEAEAFVSGRKAAGAKEAPGHLTGYNFMRGHYDPSPQTLMRAHLKTQKVLDEARFQNEFNRRYPFKNADLAKLIEERSRADKTLTSEQRAAHQRIADQLRASKDTYFNSAGKGSAWTHAKAVQQLLKELGVETAPVRVAHPFATAAFRQGMAEHLLEHADLQDKLEPHIPGEEQLRSRLEPHPEIAEHDMSSGPVALVHPKIAAKLKEYEQNLGQAHLGQLPANWWRRVNVAFSVRHPAGVTQEIGIRALLNNIGFLSLTRGSRFHHYLKEWAEHNPDPVVKTQFQRLEANVGGTYASFAGSQGKRIPLRQLENTAVERPAKWWVNHEAQKLSGPPLKGIRVVVGAMGKATNAILHAERKAIETPPMKAGMGKHFAEEFQRMHGKRMKVIGSMRDVEKAFLQGRLDPKAIDHAAQVFKDYWGDWKSSSPKFRKYQSFSPFLRWYVNSLRFIYHTMPKDHPIQTGLLVTLEDATREQRLAEGQEYTKGFDAPEGKLEPFQQGSLPLPGGKRYGFEYYSPPGAVSEGLESAINASLPWATGLFNTMQGVDPLTHEPLEEVNPETGKKEPIKSQSKLAMLGVLAGLETMAPPVRYASALQKKPAGYVFRPLRTEKEHKVGHSSGKSQIGSPIGGGSIGSGSIGSSLK